MADASWSSRYHCHRLKPCPSLTPRATVLRLAGSRAGINCGLRLVEYTHTSCRSPSATPIQQLMYTPCGQRTGTVSLARLVADHVLSHGQVRVLRRQPRVTLKHTEPHHLLRPAFSSELSHDKEGASKVIQRQWGLGGEPEEFKKTNVRGSPCSSMRGAASDHAKLRLQTYI